MKLIRATCKASAWPAYILRANVWTWTVRLAVTTFKLLGALVGWPAPMRKAVVVVAAERVTVVGSEGRRFSGGPTATGAGFGGGGGGGGGGVIVVVDTLPPRSTFVFELGTTHLVVTSTNWLSFMCP